MKDCNCNKSCCDPCGGCNPAQYGCSFDIQVDPFDPTTWLFTTNCATRKVKIPKIDETNTILSANYVDDELVFNGEKTVSKVDGAQLGGLINVEYLRDVKFDDLLPGNCSQLVYHKNECEDGCNGPKGTWTNFNINSEGAKKDGIDYISGATADGCPAYLDKPDNCAMLVFSPSCSNPSDKWEAYQIPETDTTVDPDEAGYYHVLAKNDCGCIEERKLPVMPSGMTALNYQRDSVPDDPDFPWYYGCYNDTINLHLADNAPQYFGKYALKVTVNYGVQAIKSDMFDFNYNWRSIVVPGIVGETRRTDMEGSILQNWGMAGTPGDGFDCPWGTTSLRGSFVFIVPKGKEAYLHHEYRIRTFASFPNYYTGAWDGQKVPDSEATLDHALHPASRLNALQVIIEPTQGATDFEPVKDAYRNQLDAPIDDLPQDY